MNNKGFIATSLIYSFFLIFITLFLTIIADYLQNKVLLNTIENGIKDNINNTKSLEDFEVGDMLFFGENITIGTISFTENTNWIIAAITFDNKDTLENEASIILYNTKPEITDDEIIENNVNIVTENNIEIDLLLTNNFNDTRIHELLTSSEGDYKILDKNNNPINIKKDCININETIITYNSCDGTLENYRERVIIDEFDEKIEVEPKTLGGFTITGVS